jgi:hypothetical protein
MAVVQAAVYDAVEAIGGKFKPYHVQIPGASGSPEAATAKAAHDVLVNIFPAQTASLDTAYRDYLAKKGLADNDPGVTVGQTAAAGILALRASDGRVPNPLPPPFTGDKAQVCGARQPPISRLRRHPTRLWRRRGWALPSVSHYKAATSSVPNHRPR